MFGRVHDLDRGPDWLHNCNWLEPPTHIVRDCAPPPTTISRAVLRWTAVYTVLLPSADASLLGEDGARVRRPDPTTDWPSFSILVRPQFKSSPDVNYTMEAIPVGSEGVKMLYDISAKFDKNSGLDRPITSYMQTDGYATEIDTSNAEKPSVCLDSESGPYPIPPINALVEEISKRQANRPDGIPNDYCGVEYDVVIGDKSYAVCEGRGGNFFAETIVGDMVINLTRKDGVDVFSNGGLDSGCKPVVKPFVTAHNIKHAFKTL